MSGAADPPVRPRDRVLLTVAVVANLVLLYWPRPLSAGGDVPHLDKVAHLIVFGAVAWTGLQARVPARWLLSVLVAHAALSELAQTYLLPQRSGDLADVVADLAGVVAGSLLARASWRHEHAAPLHRRD